jgi:putative selenium metabolism hydrolase
MSRPLADRDVIELAQELVRIPSVSGDERKVAEYLAAIITPVFDDVRVDVHGNVIAEMAGGSPGPTILLNGHLDVVDAGAMEDPWSARLIDGARWSSPGEVMWGRGTTDMKGALAAMVGAVSDVRAQGFAGHIVYTAVVLEEPGGGAGSLAATRALGRTPDVAISGEPTDFHIGLGHRGKVELELETRGKTAHSSIPHTGINALLLMNAFLNAWPELPMPEHPVAGACTSAITNISVSPGRLAVIPDRCRLHFDVRFLPGESHERPVADVRRLCERLRAAVPSFEYELRQRIVMPPYLMPPDHPAVDLLAGIVQAEIGRAPERRCYTGGTDGTYLWNEFGIPVLGCGPGRIDLAHSPIEHVRVDDLLAARRIYAKLIQALGTAPIPWGERA